jgi:hypothetical protein
MTKRKTLWRWWAKAIGEKASKDDKESDVVASVRTFIFFTYLITNIFIVAGVIRHWNDGTERLVEIDQRNKREYFGGGSYSKVPLVYCEQVPFGYD